MATTWTDLDEPTRDIVRRVNRGIAAGYYTPDRRTEYDTPLWQLSPQFFPRPTTVESYRSAFVELCEECTNGMQRGYRCTLPNGYVATLCVDCAQKLCSRS